MQRTLARLERVRLPLLEREQPAAILQHEAGARRHQARAEAAVVALNERDDVAVLVDHGHVDRVVALRVGHAVEPGGLDRAGGLRGVDQLRARCAARGLLRSASTGISRESRIADVPQHVGVGQLLRLDHHVQRVGAVEAVLAERILLHQVQHHQRGDALRVRANLVDVPAAIGRLDRRHPFRLELAEIGGGERAALLARDREDRVGGLALVEAIAAVRGDQPQRAGEVGIAEHLARPSARGRRR